MNPDGTSAGGKPKARLRSLMMTPRNVIRNLRPIQESTKVPRIRANDDAQPSNVRIIQGPKKSHRETSSFKTNKYTDRALLRRLEKNQEQSVFEATSHSDNGLALETKKKILNVLKIDEKTAPSHSMGAAIISSLEGKKNLVVKKSFLSQRIIYSYTIPKDPLTPVKVPSIIRMSLIHTKPINSKENFTTACIILRQHLYPQNNQSPSSSSVTEFAPSKQQIIPSEFEDDIFTGESLVPKRNDLKMKKLWTNSPEFEKNGPVFSSKAVSSTVSHIIENEELNTLIADSPINLKIFDKSKESKRLNKIQVVDADEEYEGCFPGAFQEEDNDDDENLQHHDEMPLSKRKKNLKEKNEFDKVMDIVHHKYS